MSHNPATLVWDHPDQWPYFAAVQQPLLKLPTAIGRIGCYGGWLSSLSLDKADDHVLCRNRLLTQAGGCRLYTHDHATVIVHEIVVVVSQPGRRSAFGGIGGSRTRRRHRV